MRLHHVFDWNGFTFAAKIVALSVAVGLGGHWVLQYAANPHPSAAPSLVLIQENRPAQTRPASLLLSTTTSEHIIRTLTIADAVPPTGKLIAADLRTMVLTLYQDGTAIAKYPILATGEPGSLYETPAGFYPLLAKESDHFDGSAEIDLPWSIQFSGNSFIHGWPYGADGSPIDSSSTAGDIRLSTEDAAKVYAFADTGTNVFVYNPTQAPTSSLALDPLPTPAVSASAYLVADIDTGDVFLEQNAGNPVSIKEATRLLTALVASNVLAADTKLTLPREILSSKKAVGAKAKDIFLAGDLLYPLLMQPDTIIATSLAHASSTLNFVDWMNTTAQTLDMHSTHFADASGTSTENISTAEDLFRLAAYLTDEKSFILNIARTSGKDLVATSGNVYHVDAGTLLKHTLLSVVGVPSNGVERRAAIVVLNSENAVADTTALANWFTQSVQQGAEAANTACITCAIIPPYRTIQR